MRKPIFIIFLSCMLFLLLAVSFASQGEYGQTQAPLSLSSFKNIDLSVKSANITLQEGETFQIAYHLHDREKVTQLEVIDNTLYFKTGIQLFHRVHFGDFFVTITVPKGHEMDTLTLSTVAGNIQIEDKQINGVTLKSTSGNVHFDNNTAQSGHFESVSGALSLNNNTVSKLSAKTTSGNLHAEGVYDTSTLYSVSGALSFVTSTLKSASLESVSGDVNATVPPCSMQAKSYGKILYNGLHQGTQFSLQTNAHTLHIKSVSGRIDITEKAEKK